MEDYIQCFSCGARSLAIEGETHKYMLSAPGCYAMFLEVMEREYSDFRYARGHHYSVDAYAVQHPGDPEDTRATNSVGIHLASLYFLIEQNMELAMAAGLKSAFAQFNKTHHVVTPLAPPDGFGGFTVFDVWDNDDPQKHFALCERWANDAWLAWQSHHGRIKAWAAQFLEASGFGHQLKPG